MSPEVDAPVLAADPAERPHQLSLPLADSPRWDELFDPADFLDPVTAW